MAGSPLLAPRSINHLSPSNRRLPGSGSAWWPQRQNQVLVADYKEPRRAWTPQPTAAQHLRGTFPNAWGKVLRHSQTFLFFLLHFSNIWQRLLCKLLLLSGVFLNQNHRRNQNRSALTVNKEKKKLCCLSRAPNEPKKYYLQVLHLYHFKFKKQQPEFIHLRPFFPNVFKLENLLNVLSI